MIKHKQLTQTVSILAYLKKQHSTSFNICQDMLKSGNLLHSRGLVDSQLHTTVYLVANFWHTPLAFGN